MLDIDTRADVYALGVLFYELLTSTTFFDRRRLHPAAFDDPLHHSREGRPAEHAAERPGRNALGRVGVASYRAGEAAGTGGATRLDRTKAGKDRGRRYESPVLRHDIERHLAMSRSATPPGIVYRAEVARAGLRSSHGFVMATAVAVLMNHWIGLSIARPATAEAERAAAQAEELPPILARDAGTRRVRHQEDQRGCSLQHGAAYRLAGSSPRAFPLASGLADPRVGRPGCIRRRSVRRSHARSEP